SRTACRPRMQTRSITTYSPSCVPALQPGPQPSGDQEPGGDYLFSRLPRMSRAPAISIDFVNRLGATNVTCRKQDDRCLPPAQSLSAMVGEAAADRPVGLFRVRRLSDA